MSEHTPGPWTVDPLSDRKYYGTVVRLSDDTTLLVWGSRVWRPSARELAKWGPESDTSDLMCDGHYEDERDLANAHLIAAAPKMLAVLKSIQWLADAEGTPFCSCCSHFRNKGHHPKCSLATVIAEAEGRS